MPENTIHRTQTNYSFVSDARSLCVSYIRLQWLSEEQRYALPEIWSVNLSSSCLCYRMIDDITFCKTKRDSITTRSPGSPAISEPVVCLVSVLATWQKPFTNIFASYNTVKHNVDTFHFSRRATFSVYWAVFVSRSVAEGWWMEAILVWKVGSSYFRRSNYGNWSRYVKWVMQATQQFIHNALFHLKLYRIWGNNSRVPLTNTYLKWPPTMDFQHQALAVFTMLCMGGWKSGIQTTVDYDLGDW
jgi:hypothetical protein